MKVTISVVTATWNCAEMIRDCLDSIACQTWEEREHIVIDGGSRDGTVDLLNSHRQDLAVLVSEPDNGLYDALNKGIACAKGDVIGFLHADDIYSGPGVLAHVAEAFADPAVDAIYGDLEYVRRDDPDRVVRYWKSKAFSERRLRWGWMPPHPTLYVRRKWYELIGGFDTRYRIAADYYSMLQLFSRKGFNASYVPEVLVKMRMGGMSNRSLANIVQKSREDLDAMRRAQLGGLGALAWKNLTKLGQFRAL